MGTGGNPGSTGGQSPARGLGWVVGRAAWSTSPPVSDAKMEVGAGSHQV